MATFEKIATVDVGAGGQAAIDFTVIPSTFTDLCILISARDSVSAIASSCSISFNGSTSSFSGIYLQGSGAGPATGSLARFIGNNVSSTATANTFSNAVVYIPNYAAAVNKSFSVDAVTENNATTAYTNLVAGLWSNTAAITSISLTPASGNFVQYSTATLYGIKKA